MFFQIFRTKIIIFWKKFSDCINFCYFCIEILTKTGITRQQESGGSLQLMMQEPFMIVYLIVITF